VFGLEGDINWSGFGSDFNDVTYGTQHTRDWEWFSTLRLRAGLTTGDALFYATGGVAAVGVNFKGDYDPENDCGDYYGYCLNETQFGLALGGGVEYAFTENMSVKLEGLWIGLPSTAVDDPYNADTDAYTVSSSVAMVRAGLNFSF
jgi:outer membrane immunogenic protein